MTAPPSTAHGAQPTPMAMLAARRCQWMLGPHHGAPWASAALVAAPPSPPGGRRGLRGLGPIPRGPQLPLPAASVMPHRAVLHPPRAADDARALLAVFAATPWHPPAALGLRAPPCRIAVPLHHAAPPPMSHSAHPRWSRAQPPLRLPRLARAPLVLYHLPLPHPPPLHLHPPLMHPRLAMGPLPEGGAHPLRPRRHPTPLRRLPPRPCLVRMMSACCGASWTMLTLGWPRSAPGLQRSCELRHCAGSRWSASSLLSVWRLRP